jgi:hypothetical protein
MKRGIKWFLGIVIGLAVVAVLIGAGFLVFNRGHEAGWMMGGRFLRFGNNEGARAWRNVPGQEMPWGARPQNNQPMGSGWVAPMTRLGGFRPLRILFGCLIGIGFLLLVVLGVIYLVRSLVQPKQPVVTTAMPVTPARAPNPTSVHACPHCGRPVQDDWSHCPHCGGPLTGQAEITTPQAL